MDAYEMATQDAWAELGEQSQEQYSDALNEALAALRELLDASVNACRNLSHDLCPPGLRCDWCQEADKARQVLAKYSHD